MLNVVEFELCCSIGYWIVFVVLVGMVLVMVLLMCSFVGSVVCVFGDDDEVVVLFGVCVLCIC